MCCAVLPEPTEIAIGTPLKQEVSDVLVERMKALDLHDL
jgi:hypothetical protein